jgi:hypothetical protein
LASIPRTKSAVLAFLTNGFLQVAGICVDRSDGLERMRINKTPYEKRKVVLDKKK